MSSFGKHRGLQAVAPLGGVFAAGMARSQPVPPCPAQQQRATLPSVASVMRSRHAYLQHIANPIYKAIPAALAPASATHGRPGYKLQITGFTV